VHRGGSLSDRREGLLGHDASDSSQISAAGALTAVFNVWPVRHLAVKCEASQNDRFFEYGTVGRGCRRKASRSRIFCCACDRQLANSTQEISCLYLLRGRGSSKKVKWDRSQYLLKFYAIQKREVLVNQALLLYRANPHLTYPRRTWPLAALLTLASPQPHPSSPAFLCALYRLTSAHPSCLGCAHPRSRGYRERQLLARRIQGS